MQTNYLLKACLSTEEKKLLNVISLIHKNADFQKEIDDMPAIRIMPIDLCRFYLESYKCNQEDIDEVISILHSISQKKIPITLDEEVQVTVGRNAETRINRTCFSQNIIKISEYLEGMTDNELNEWNSGNTSRFKDKLSLLILINKLVLTTNF